MGVVNQAGSIALPKRLMALGSVVTGLYVHGLDSVTAVVLGLTVTVVLSVVLS